MDAKNTCNGTKDDTSTEPHWKQSSMRVHVLKESVDLECQPYPSVNSASEPESSFTQETGCVKVLADNGSSRLVEADKVSSVIRQDQVFVMPAEPSNHPRLFRRRRTQSNSPRSLSPCRTQTRFETDRAVSSLPSSSPSSSTDEDDAIFERCKRINAEERLQEKLAQYKLLRNLEELETEPELLDAKKRMSPRQKGRWASSFSGMSCSLFRVTRRVLAGIMVGLLFLFLYLLMHAVNLRNQCKPPELVTSQHQQSSFDARPLIDYYVHGRGRGHLSRSTAIIQRLTAEGYDVRLYTGRHVDAASLEAERKLASPTRMEGVYHTLLDEEELRMWRESLGDSWSDTDPLELDPTNAETTRRTGRVIEIKDFVSMHPSIGLFRSIYMALDRIWNDCEETKNSRPVAVVTDGDIPSMLRAVLSSIPSLCVSHGQSFALVSPPDWLDEKGKDAWDRARLPNFNSCIYGNYRIGTNHVPLKMEKNHEYVSRPRMRNDVVRMGIERKVREERWETHPVPASVANAVARKNRIIVAYFRDGNGCSTMRAVLESGFDVLSFGESSCHGIGFESKSDQDHVGRLIHIEDSSLFVPLLSVADGVISSAGSQLSSECIFTRVPILALYNDGDAEQMLNVEMVVRAESHDGNVVNPYDRKVHMFGTSFEKFNLGFPELNQDIQQQSTAVVAAGTRGGGGSSVTNTILGLEDRQAVQDEFYAFVQVVSASVVSRSFYTDVLGGTERDVLQEVLQRASSADTMGVGTRPSQREDGSIQDSMPDVSDVVLGVLKQVEQLPMEKPTLTRWITGTTSGFAQMIFSALKVFKFF